MKNKEKTDKDPEIIRFALLRKPNKRIEILALKDSDGTVAVTINTKRLIGPWKERRIHTAGVCYGVESFMVIHDIFSMLIADPLFMKAINREVGQMQKDMMNCKTNIEHKKRG